MRSTLSVVLIVGGLAACLAQQPSKPLFVPDMQTYVLNQVPVVLPCGRPSSDETIPLLVSINDRGMVSAARLDPAAPTVRSANGKKRAYADEALLRAAEVSVKASLYRPFLVNGVRVPVSTVVHVRMTGKHESPCSNANGEYDASISSPSEINPPPPQLSK